MLLLLASTAKQQADLDALLIAQQTPGNVEFHRFLSASEFTQRFRLSAASAASVAGWLRAQGFAVAASPATRGWIEFSGSGAQVEKAFGARLVTSPNASGAGSRHQILNGSIHLPPSFAPPVAGLIAGLVSLDGTASTAAMTEPVALKSSPAALAAEKSMARAEALSPALAAEWLQLNRLHAAGTTGAGETIAIPTRSNVRVEDFDAFRKAFGLPASTLGVQQAGGEAGTDINDDAIAATQAADWAGVAAPEARILLVPAASTNATDGFDLALAAAVDGTGENGGPLANTISVDYSSCEAGMSAAHREFYAALYRQAAAEGIAVIAATGDSGAAACHLPADASPVTTGRGVNALASTPWNTAVGSASFASDGNSLTTWKPANETATAYATGGGASRYYASPSWQAALGLPLSQSNSAATQNAGQYLGEDAAQHRYLPDLSLPTAADGISSRGLAFCFSADAHAANDCHLISSGGSGAAAALFSGIAALLAQKYGPQGNLAPNLYALSRAGSGAGLGAELGDADSNPKTSNLSDESVKTGQAILDITSGNNKLPCMPGSSDCVGSGEGKGGIGYSAAAGYDLATGLGTVDAQALVSQWTTPQVTGTATATVEMLNVGGITYNPSKDITLTAKVISGSGGTIPTGTVQFFDESNTQNAGSPVTLAADGTASYTEDGQFSIGGHNIAAIYSGDSIYAPGQSQPITINIQPSPTTLVVSPSTTTPTGGSSITVTGTLTSSIPGDSPPTGSLTVNLDGLPQGTQRFTTTDSVTTASVNVTVPTAGAHTVQGTYSGDINYNNSTSPSVTVTVAKGATVTSLVATPSTLSAGVPESFTATVAPFTVATGAVYSITGTISFYDGTTLLGTAALASNSAVLPGITLSATAIHTITAVYSGDASFSPSTSSPLILEPVLLPVTVVLSSNSSVLAPGQTANLTATVTPVSTPVITAEQHPTGNVLFYAGTTLIGSGTLVVGTGDAGIVTISVPSLPAGQYTLTAVYAGDLTYGPATSNSLNLQVEDFSITCSTFNITMVQGTTQTVTCNVASLGGLTGPIQVACSEQNPPQVGPIGCTFDPTVINGGNGQTTLTVATTASSVSLSDIRSTPMNGLPFRPSHPDRPADPWLAAGGGGALALAGILLWPTGRRGRRLGKRFRQASARSLLGLALLLAGMAGAGMGCSNSATITRITGTPLGVHTLKISAAANVNTVTVTHNTYLTVNVTTASGN